MFFVDMMFALVPALVLSLFFPWALGWRRPGQEVLWDNMVFLFILIFIIIHYLGQVPWLRTLFYDTSNRG